MSKAAIVGAALVWALLMISCSTVNINCNYFKIVEHTLVQTCVEERGSGIPIHRGKDI